MVTTAVRAKRQEALSKFVKTREAPKPLKALAGTFFCDGHLDFLPLGKQSKDKRYCKECFEAARDSASSVNGDRPSAGDYWVANKGIFITGGRGYGITPDLRTVCRGKEEDILLRIGRKTTPKDTVPTDKALQNLQLPITTTPKKEQEKKPKRKQIRKVLQNPPSEEKSPGGRPKKELPAAKIMKLHRQGLGTRTIARQLLTDGVTLSHVTIHRMIQAEKQKEKGQLVLPIGGS